MNYEESVAYIHSLEKFGIKPGLERVSELCEAIGNPQDELKFIHVAGTNGKGSTSTFISNAFLKSGKTVGLYTSPYVIDFRERVQINGKLIEKEDIAYCISVVREKTEYLKSGSGFEITEFEALTAAAFLAFRRAGCDIVVLEVGLGGRFDATNIIKNPMASVIVRIGMDHVNILGDTIEKIASEKCGIIKSGSPVISYPYQRPEALGVISSECAESDSELIIPGESDLIIREKNYDGTCFDFENRHYKIRLPGEHMVYNAVTAITVCEKVGLSYEFIRSGLESTVMPARMEILSRNPLIILDGGHNEDCAEALENYLNLYFLNKTVIMVSSLMADKDFDTYLRKTASHAKIHISTNAHVPRALDSEKLKECASSYCDNCISVPDPVDAVDMALSKAGKDDVIVICGSFYLAGEVRSYILNKFRKENKNDQNNQ